MPRAKCKFTGWTADDHEAAYFTTLAINTRDPREYTAIVRGKLAAWVESHYRIFMSCEDGEYSARCIHRRKTDTPGKLQLYWSPWVGSKLTV